MTSRSDLCENCWKRPGEIVIDEIIGPLYPPHQDEPIEAFRFTYRMCRWCKAARTRWLKRMKGQ